MKKDKDKKDKKKSKDNNNKKDNKNVEKDKKKLRDKDVEKDKKKPKERDEKKDKKKPKDKDEQKDKKKKITLRVRLEKNGSVWHGYRHKAYKGGFHLPAQVFGWNARLSDSTVQCFLFDVVRVSTCVGNIYHQGAIL